MPDDLNFVHGVWCPPVVKVQPAKPGKPPTPVFEWKDRGVWHTGDELPAHIAAALPGPEWSACENHRYRRLRRALPPLEEQATVSAGANWGLDWLFPDPETDEFGIRITQPWVSPTLLKIARPHTRQFDGWEFAQFRERLLRELARIHQIPSEFLVPAPWVS